MKNLPLRRAALAALLTTVSLTPAVAAKDSTTSGVPTRMTMTYDGPVLTTPSGMSLYVVNGEDMRLEKFKWQCTNIPPTRINDQQSGIGERPQIGFKLIKSCVDKFHPYLADANAKAVGDYSIAQRPEGGRQWVYRGYPLYTSIRDTRPGDRNGSYSGGGYAGRGGGYRLAWQAIDLPSGLKFARKEQGLVLITAVDQKQVYTPRGGARMIKAGVGADDFKPLAAPGVATVSGDWSIVENGAGVRQYSYKGKPLYTPPSGTSEFEITGATGWDPLVISRAPSVPAAFGKQLSLIGEVYTDKKGMTLYAYNCNAGGGAGGPRVINVSCEEAGDPAQWMVAVCGSGEECARRWHPYLAPAGARPEGEFSIVDITYPMFTDPHGVLYPADAPHVKVWAYRGKPLFTYANDEKPTDIYGHNTAGLWGSGFAAIEVPGTNAIFDP